MKIARLHLLACTASALCGCSIPIYQDATGPDTAKLRLRMEKPIVSNLLLSAVDLETCKTLAVIPGLSGQSASAYTRRVGMLDSPPTEEGVLEFVIPANKPLAARTIIHTAKVNAAEILFVMNPVTQDEIRKKQPAVCPAPGFLPKQGQQYEISYAASPGTCKTTIYQLKQDDAAVTRVDITRELNLSVINQGSGKFICEAPQDQSAGTPLPVNGLK